MGKAKITIIVIADVLNFASRYACPVARKKAKRWARAMRDNLQNGILEARAAAKHAGKMSFAVTVAADRCGRAYVRMLHRKAHAPLQHAAISMWTRLSLQ